jgi:hypothetical protein
MNISRDTWHAKSFDYWKRKSTSELKRQFNGQSMSNDRYTPRMFGGDGLKRPVTLCSYFWIAVLRSPLLRLTHLAQDNPKVSIPSLLLIAMLAMGFLGLLAEGTFIGGLLFFFGMLGLIAAFLGLMYTGAVVSEKASERGGLLPEYVRAKKRKVCPIIEFDG